MSVGFIIGILANIGVKMTGMEILPMTALDIFDNNKTKANSNNSLNLTLSIQNSIRDVINNNINKVVNIIAKSKVDIENISPKYLNEVVNDNDYETIGSGFLINKKGYIVTNYHVVQHSKKLKISFIGTNWIDASLLAYDKKFDIAIIKSNELINIEPVKFADSENLHIGDFTIAIGNPYGLEGTANFGIISGIGRNKIGHDSNWSKFKNYIQTDAPINQGNSGGPLLNIKGEVIGMNSAIYSPSEGSIGIGFATPVNTVKAVAKRLIKYGRIEHVFVGINYDHSQKKSQNGIYIKSIYTDSPAHKAGLVPGERIIKLNNIPIYSGYHFDMALLDYRIGDNLTITVYNTKEKNEKEITFKLTEEI